MLKERESVNSLGEWFSQLEWCRRQESTFNQQGRSETKVYQLSSGLWIRWSALFGKQQGNQFN